MATKCGTPSFCKEWQAAAECGATQMKRLLLKRRTQIEQDQRAITVMARWLAGKHVRERYRAQGVKVDAPLWRARFRCLWLCPQAELVQGTVSRSDQHRSQERRRAARMATCRGRARHICHATLRLSKRRR